MNARAIHAELVLSVLIIPDRTDANVLKVHCRILTLRQNATKLSHAVLTQIVPAIPYVMIRKDVCALNLTLATTADVSTY